MTESWHLYLTSSRLFVRRAHGLFRRHVEQVSELAWDRTALPAPLLRRPQDAAERPLYVYVGSSMLRWAAFKLQLHDARERLLATRACMQSHYDMDPLDWVVQAQASGIGGYTLACAMRTNLLDGLHGLARANELRLVAVRPYVQAVWNTFSARHRWPATLVTVEPDSFTMMVPGSGKELCISSFCHRQQSGLIERELVRMTMAGASAAHQDVHIAVSDQLLHMLPHKTFQSRPMCRTTYLQCDLYSDFRDLAFCGEVPG